MVTILYATALPGARRAPPCRLHRVVTCTAFTIGSLARWAIASLIAGIGLLNVANAGWAHAIGVACLLCFIVIAFRLIIAAALAEQPATR